jgi:hypothetical protein
MTPRAIRRVMISRAGRIEASALAVLPVKRHLARFPSAYSRPTGASVYIRGSASAGCPRVDRGLDPLWDWHRPDMPVLADEIGDAPVLLALPDRLQRERQRGPRRNAAPAAFSGMRQNLVRCGVLPSTQPRLAARVEDGRDHLQRWLKPKPWPRPMPRRSFQIL